MAECSVVLHLLNKMLLEIERANLRDDKVRLFAVRATCAYFKGQTQDDFLAEEVARDEDTQFLASLSLWPWCPTQPHRL